MFKSLFKPVVIDIQNCGRTRGSQFASDTFNEAYLEEDDKTFLCSDLFRGQLEGLVDYVQSNSTWPFANFSASNFSPTGAARSMSIDIRRLFMTWFITNPAKALDEWQHILER